MPYVLSEFGSFGSSSLGCVYVEGVWCLYQTGRAPWQIKNAKER